MSVPDLEARVAKVSGALYFIAGLLVCLSAVDLLLNVFPFAPSTANWRYGAIGLAAGFWLTPLLGLGMLLGLGAVQQDRWALRGVQVVGWALMAATFLALMIFALDVIQVRAEVPVENRRAFDIGVGRAIGKHLLGMLAAGLCGWGAGSVLKDLPATPTDRKTRPLVVGADRT